MPSTHRGASATTIRTTQLCVADPGRGADIDPSGVKEGPIMPYTVGCRDFEPRGQATPVARVATMRYDSPYTGLEVSTGNGSAASTARGKRTVNVLPRFRPSLCASIRH